eukprot:1161401-Pelagomonas_calceolata.AAC.3
MALQLGAGSCTLERVRISLLIGQSYNCLLQEPLGAGTCTLVGVLDLVAEQCLLLETAMRGACIWAFSSSRPSITLTVRGRPLRAA